jgi:hypothetical protein
MGVREQVWVELTPDHPDTAVKEERIRVFVGPDRATATFVRDWAPATAAAGAGIRAGIETLEWAVFDSTPVTGTTHTGALQLTTERSLVGGGVRLTYETFVTYAALCP